MTQSTFRFKLRVPRRVGKRSREEFYEWLWQEFESRGLMGVHEGTLLSEQASEQGLETESWTVDAGEAPRERDWIESQNEEEAELYFASPEEAEAAARELVDTLGLAAGPVEEQVPQDWDAEWKKSFLGSPEGVAIPPCWRVVPPWNEGAAQGGEIFLKINPGAGFGTGTHETTQLCMQAIAECWPVVSAGGSRPVRVLDFGSGSGILSVAAALLGGKVEGVEIDPLAIDNAVDNAVLNSVESRVSFSQTLEAAPGPYPLVIANILKPVLLEFADQLIARLEPQGGVLILSGLIEADVRPVSERYSKLLGGRAPEVNARGEWRSLVWRPTATSAPASGPRK